MKSLMWRMGEECGALYTEDRQALRRVLELGRLAARAETDATTYTNARGKVFAWQVTFALSLWSRVLRSVGREAVTIVPEEAGRTRAPDLGRSAPTPARPAKGGAAPAKVPGSRPAAGSPRKGASSKPAAASSAAWAAEPMKPTTGRASRSGQQPAKRAVDPSPRPSPKRGGKQDRATSGATGSAKNVRRPTSRAA